MNYKIITDEKLLREFIEWLPDLKPTEKFYCCLFARSKYTKDEEGKNGMAHIKSDKAQLKRFVSDKERLYDKIRQLEVPIGAYKQRETVIPQKALALYITPNPRDLWKATHNSLVKLATCIRDSNTLNNPHQEVMSEIQRTRGTGHYVDFDIDLKDKNEITDVKLKVLGIINPEAVDFLETRGGLHVLVKPSKVRKDVETKWYQLIKNIPGVDQSGDTMCPVVGTFQGGFTPHFIDL